MDRIAFGVFTLVYVATALATLLAFLAQSRVIPSGLAPNEVVPHLGILISAVLVETVGGYIALTKNLFGLRYSELQHSESEHEIKALAITTMKILSRLQALAYRHSSDFQRIVLRLQGSHIGGLLTQFGLATVSERNQRILDITKKLEATIVDAEQMLLTDDKGRIQEINERLNSYLPTIERWLES